MLFEDAAVASKYLVKTNYIFKVMEFHPETQTVDLVQDVYEFCNVPDGEFTVNNEFGIDVSAGLKDLDVLLDIPVLQLRWGQFEIQCCPKQGDTGVLAVFTNDVGNWIVDGGPSIPNSDDHFDKSSAVFIPFIPNKKNCATDYPSDNNSLVIKSTGAKITLTDDGHTSGVSIEADTLSVEASDGISLKGDVNIDGDVVANEVTLGGVAMSSHVHVSAAPGSNTGGPVPAPIP